MAKLSLGDLGAILTINLAKISKIQNLSFFAPFFGKIAVNILKWTSEPQGMGQMESFGPLQPSNLTKSFRKCVPGICQIGLTSSLK